MDEALRSGQVEACGSGPVLTLMELARRGGARFTLVEQTDSSEASGDDRQVVGYLSAAALRTEGVR
jgi:AmmeMemoRadiSam system protein B